MVKIKELLKKSRFIRKFGKKINIYIAFFRDAKDFSKYYLESAEEKGDYRYSVLLLVHSIEKGMCMPILRPFGFSKVKELMKYLRNFDDKECFEYKIGISILFEWVAIFEENKWSKNKTFEEVCAFLKNKYSNIKTGKKVYSPFKDICSSYDGVVLSRHSVRDFKNKGIDINDLKLALHSFTETPTACNRQMCRVLYVKKQEIKDMLNNIIIGLQGFNKDNINYFLITYDLAAFAYSGERQQGLFNAGLCTMNFVNGLHAKGIGACCLQWSNKYKEDKKIRQVLGLAESERIAVVIGAGYYLDENVIPYSERRKEKDVLKIL